MGENLFAALCYFQPIEEMTVINSLPASRSFILQETANHKLVEGLAEASRARKQSNLRLAFNQFFYHQSLIDEISVFINEFFEILHTDGYFFSFFLLVHRPQLLSQSSYPHFPCAPQETSCRFRAAQLSPLSIVYWNPSKETSKKQKAAVTLTRRYL
ncbi:unknown [Firmicutes bacterium CAG:238]|nr:unknown [Firmicutes bacterium CAG:238]